MSDLKKYLGQKVGKTDDEKLIDRNAFPEFFPENRSPYYNVRIFYVNNNDLRVNIGNYYSGVKRLGHFTNEKYFFFHIFKTLYFFTSA